MLCKYPHVWFNAGLHLLVLQLLQWYRLRGVPPSKKNYPPLPLSPLGLRSTAQLFPQLLFPRMPCSLTDIRVGMHTLVTPSQQGLLCRLSLPVSKSLQLCNDWLALRHLISIFQGCRGEKSTGSKLWQKQGEIPYSPCTQCIVGYLGDAWHHTWGLLGMRGPPTHTCVFSSSPSPCNYQITSRVML